MSKKVHCPYNRNHEFNEEKLISHVIKCSKNYPETKDLQCPYISTHYVPKHEYQQHVLSECEGRPNQEQLGKIINYNEINKLKNKPKKEEIYGSIQKYPRDNFKPKTRKNYEERSEGREIIESREYLHEKIEPNLNSNPRGAGEKAKKQPNTELDGVIRIEKKSEPVEEQKMKNETTKVESIVIKKAEGFTLTRKKVVSNPPDEENHEKIKNSSENSSGINSKLSSECLENKKIVPELDENEKIAKEREKECQNQIF